ncbi:MAG: lipopolysaccharide biosynthesis protein, partial [Bacteroidia bacterium]|nr:lipopolysaccharide biosynthesis protein [Bacteroidia bacterium]
MEVEMSEIKAAITAYFQYLKRNKLFLIIPFIIGLALGISYAILKKPKYEARVSFIINESDKGIGGSLLSLAGQSGLLLGGGGLTPN